MHAIVKTKVRKIVNDTFENDRNKIERNLHETNANYCNYSCNCNSNLVVCAPYFEDYYSGYV